MSLYVYSAKIINIYHIYKKTVRKLTAGRTIFPDDIDRVLFRYFEDSRTKCKKIGQFVMILRK